MSKAKLPLQHTAVYHTRLMLTELSALFQKESLL